jgi:flagellar L-ring protein precursor FlgH
VKRVVVTLMLAASACAPAHIAAYTPKDRATPTPFADVRAAEPPANGSLFTASASAGGLFTDERAHRINDVVVVRVEENADAERSADTNLARKSDIKPLISVIPLLAPLVAAPSLSASAEAGNDQSFAGSGQSDRRERLVATVSAIVKQVTASGNLFIEGHRVILVNNEEHHLYVSGLVRPIDIDEQNSVKSSLIAEAHIEFVGQGDLTDSQQQGWLASFWRFIWPF